MCLLATYFEPPIKRIAVEAFRGFRDRQEFDLAASAVIVSGPNGTGKTSFFDAIQWCLLGSIERLEGLRARRNVEHIVNQYRLGDRAAVELQLSVHGSSLTIRRTGDHRGSTLEFAADGGEAVFGEDAESRLEEELVRGGDLTLEMALTTSGLMQQDVMRAVLEAKPADRYRHISTVLGLGALEDFEGAARELAAEAKDRADAARADRDSLSASLSDAQARLGAAQQRLQTMPQVEALRQETLAVLRHAPDLVAIEPRGGIATVDEARRLAAPLGEAIDRLESFMSAWTDAEGLRRLLEAEPSEEDVTAAREARDSARTASGTAQQYLSDVESRLSSAQLVTEDITRLAALVIPMLTERCPVCGQSIDSSQVELELRARSGDTETILALQEELRRARQRVKTAAQTATEAESHARSIDAVRQRWDTYRRNLEAAEASFLAVASTAPVVVVALPSAEELAAAAGSIIEFLQTSRRRVLEFLNTLETGLDRGPVQRAESEVSSFDEALRARSRRLEEESLRAQRLKALADAAVEARVEVTEQRFKAVQPLVADIFSRLDPHPAFKTIEFELDTYYKRGRTSPVVRDLVEEVSADPLLVFSTSQANIAALSYFLAMGWSAGDRSLPFVLLDDPVQSMDDVNVLGFSDLSRHLRKARQLVVSTHERRLAQLLERKLAPRSANESTIILEFVGWDRSGPTVEHRAVEPQLLHDPIRVVQAAS